MFLIHISKFFKKIQLTAKKKKKKKKNLLKLLELKSKGP